MNVLTGGLSARFFCIRYFCSLPDGPQNENTSKSVIHLPFQYSISWIHIAAGISNDNVFSQSLITVLTAALSRSLSAFIFGLVDCADIYSSSESPSLWLSLDIIRPG
jgi:hypothetical protein